MTREVEWDDVQVAQMQALMLYRSGICPCGCGLPSSVAHDKIPFATSSVLCYARRALAVAERDHQQLSLPANKRDEDWKQGVPKPTDGVMFSVSPHQPGKAVEEVR